MNTQEKEPELGEGITSAEFWMYDGKLGRRWNVDPVVKVYQSSFCTHENNPIAYSDFLGDDVSPIRIRDNQNQTVGGIISVNFQFRFDPGLNWTNAQQQQYINNHLASVRNTWGGMTFGSGTVTIIASFTNDGTANYGRRNRRDERVTNNVIVDVGSSDNRVDRRGNRLNPENISWAAQKGGYMWLNSGNSGGDAAHEFGHILGLSDRYTEAAVWTIENNVNLQSPISKSRNTMPLRISRARESGYNPLDNLMSNSFNGSLTQFQLNIAFSRNRREKRYFRRLVLFRDIDYSRTHCVEINRFNNRVLGYTYNPSPPPSQPNYIQVTMGDYIVPSRASGGYQILPRGNNHVEKRSGNVDINDHIIKNKLRTLGI